MNRWAYHYRLLMVEMTLELQRHLLGPPVAKQSLRVAGKGQSSEMRSVRIHNLNDPYKTQGPETITQTLHLC